MDREAAAREVVADAKRLRRPTPRWIWIASLVVSAACLGGLAIGWIEDRNTVSAHPLERHEAAHESGFGVGLLVGLGAGLLIASVALVRRR
jgi:hypothetical protein